MTRWRFRPRLLPAVIGLMGVVAVLKGEALWRVMAFAGEAPGLVAAARAQDAAPAAATPPVTAGPQAPPPGEAARFQAVTPAPPPADPADLAERAILGQLRARRSEIEAREAAAAAREQVLAAAERRLAQRIAELGELQQRLEALERGRAQRDEAGWRGLVRVYEQMRPREAASIFDALELPVLVELVDRMGERKAAPVIGAMRPERARELTAELARHRAQRLPNH